MKITSFDELYVHTLQDLYSAETQLIESLPKLVEACSNEELKAQFEQHLKITQQQQQRLKEIFEDLDEEPEGHECEAMKGLIEEAEQIIDDVEDEQLLDAALIGAAQKVEHYEIAGYGTARTFAELLGYSDHVDLLQNTLNEEKEADSLLNDLALSTINEQAEMVDGEEEEEETSKSA